MQHAVQHKLLCFDRVYVAGVDTGAAMEVELGPEPGSSGPDAGEDWADAVEAADWLQEYADTEDSSDIMPPVPVDSDSAAAAAFSEVQLLFDTLLSGQPPAEVAQQIGVSFNPMTRLLSAAR